MRKFPFPRIQGPDHDLCIRPIGQCLVVKFTHIATLCPAEVSKFGQIVYACYQTLGIYILKIINSIWYCMFALRLKINNLGCLH